MSNKKTRDEIEHCFEVANEAYKQLFWSIDRVTYMSWGVSKLQYTFYEEMPSLLLRVSGMLHKGYVIVSLDEGADAYVVTLMTVRKVVKKSMKDIYCDTLGSTIDELIERPAGMNDETYRNKALQDSAKKMNMQTI